MWANIYSSSVVVVNHMVVKLKREADSLEANIQIFVHDKITLTFALNISTLTYCCFLSSIIDE